MSRKTLLEAVAGLMTVGALIAGVVLPSGARSHQSAPIPKLLKAPLAISSPLIDPNLHLTLAPAGTSPDVNAPQALRNASGAGLPGTPTGALMRYGLLTWGSRFHDRPVWLVSFQGICQFPQVPGVSDCTIRPYNTVIDARNGAFLFSYSDGT
jgi:hypothetical protein